MHTIDYKALALKCGLEIHQQLEGSKLFCNTPTQIRDDAAHASFVRQLVAVAGETGEIDSAAWAEVKKQRLYQYQAYSDTTGLVELDEEPPHQINTESLQTALAVASVLNAQVVDEIQVMRKTVVDGSNTSGFQRTALVAQNGYLLTSTNRRIDIPSIILEEDACKKVSATQDIVTYNLSRLGIPLIELGTLPQLHHPQEIAEVAEKIGLMLRSLPGVKRGIGTIRQDINISIHNKNRVEIKGAQDLRLIPTYVDMEIIRQLNIMEFAHVLLLHGYQQQSSHNVLTQDVTSIFEKTQCQLIAKACKVGKKVYACKLTNLSGFLAKELQPNRRVGTDLSEFAKVHANIGGIIHSDESLTEKYAISLQEIDAVKSALSLDKQDAFVMVVDQAPVAQAALSFVKERLYQLSFGVPKEVRSPNPDGTSSYMRPMPGQARMYPETDVLPIIPNIAAIVRPELIEEKVARYISKYQLPADRAKMIAKSEHASMLDTFFEKYSLIRPAIIVETVMGSTLKDVAKKTGVELSLAKQDFEVLFDAVQAQKILVAAIPYVLQTVASEKKALVDALDQYAPLTSQELRTIIQQVQSQFPGLSQGALLGKIVSVVKGRADPSSISQTLSHQ